MCGACGRRGAPDEWSPVLGTTRGRWEVARVLNAELRGGGEAVRVRPTTSGWLVTGATGRGSVADTVTSLWSTLAKHSTAGQMTRPKLLTGLRALPSTAVLDALVASGTVASAVDTLPPSFVEEVVRR